MDDKQGENNEVREGLNTNFLLILTGVMCVFFVINLGLIKGYICSVLFESFILMDSNKKYFERQDGITLNWLKMNMKPFMFKTMYKLIFIALFLAITIG